MIHKSVKFLKHWLRARTRYAVHSPFVYEFVTRILPAQKVLPISQTLKAHKKKLQVDNKTILIEDLGAGYGGKKQPQIQKSLREVIRSSACGRREGELLYRLVQNYQPRYLLELGTNLGFSAAYQLAASSPQSRFVTIEGATALSQMAGELLETHFPGRAELHRGDFGEVLQSIDWGQFRPDHVLIDGNHQYGPTLEYFTFLKDKCRDGSLLIFDDIYWSPGMEKAWKEICADPQVSVSIDLFFMGLVWLRKDQAKQHFSFRFIP